MSTAGAVAVWAGLLGLLGLEVLLSRVPSLGLAPPAVGLLMAGLVAAFFMDGRRVRGAAAIFAAAGLFWLLVMFGMGWLDPGTRHDIPVPVRTPP